MKSFELYIESCLKASVCRFLLSDWFFFFPKLRQILLNKGRNITHGKSLGQHGHIILAILESSSYDIITLYVPLCNYLCSASHKICVQPATSSAQHAIPISLHIRQAHCYIARLGNISNPREGRVLQLVRARCVSIKCVPIELAEQGYNTLSRVLNGPTFRSRSQTLAFLQRNARNLPAREGSRSQRAAQCEIWTRASQCRICKPSTPRKRQRNRGPIAREEKAHIPLAL